jgi:hypothetical protein
MDEPGLSIADTASVKSSGPRAVMYLFVHLFWKTPPDPRRYSEHTSRALLAMTVCSWLDETVQTSIL